MTQRFLAKKNKISYKMGTVGPQTKLSAFNILCVCLVNLLLLSRLTVSSRLDVEGAGSPCYEGDADGKEDLNKPQVRKVFLTTGSKVYFVSRLSTFSPFPRQTDNF